MTQLSIVPRGNFDLDAMFVEPQARKAFHDNTHPGAHWWVGYFDGRPGCVWGVVPPCLLDDSAYMWMACNGIVKQHWFSFARASQIVIEECLIHWPVLFGHCHDLPGERYLKFLGAKLGPKEHGMTTFRIERRQP